MTGRIFADLGAHVVQVIDDSGRFDASPAPENGAIDRFLSARKSVVRGDISNPEFTSRLLRESDVAILDQQAQRAIGADALPKHIALLTLFSGRQADTAGPASEFTISALGGLLNMVGDPDRAPLRLGGHQEAYALGLSAFCGLAGLLAGKRSAHEALTVRASLLDTVVWLNWKAVPLDGDAPIPPGRSGPAAEWQVVRCADGWVALVYQEPDWPHLCDMVGDHRLRQERFATRQHRLDNLVELAEIVESAFLSRTRQQIHQQASLLRLPLGPVWNPGEVIADPHNVERALFEKLSQFPGESHSVHAPRLPVLWNGVSLSAQPESGPATIAVGQS
ncbi:CoA transferase [Arvimicrobium flavum]|uniref:CoA transferase n=1 Tax=Arvimicrobium flavum TaxID=3393320 RepID=UPI00237C2E70|nr:CoA transferase [Mesorhizobium shangrilense]